MGLLKTTSGTEFFVDDADVALVTSRNWWAKDKYVRTKIDGKYVYLHRFLLNHPKGIVDHIDGDPGNNRRSNLRVCTQKQNTHNRAGVSGRSSRFKGVHWAKKDRVWVAQITHNYKNIHIGSFKGETLAARAYDLKSKELFGQYAKTNHNG